MKTLLYLVVNFILIGSLSVADSVFSESTGSIYNTIKKPAIGDIIVVKVSTQSSATQEAGTDTIKRSDVGIDFYQLEDLYDSKKGSGNTNDSRRTSQDLRLGGRGSYYGTGRTQRVSRVKAVISAVVTEILENGNLVIVGERKINVNDETELITLSGVVRPNDIQSDNSVFSHQIALAKVSVKGEGIVGTQQTPGLFQRLFGWIF